MTNLLIPPVIGLCSTEDGYTPAPRQVTKLGGQMGRLIPLLDGIFLFKLSQMLPMPPFTYGCALDPQLPGSRYLNNPGMFPPHPSFGCCAVK